MCSWMHRLEVISVTYWRIRLKACAEDLEVDNLNQICQQLSLSPTTNMVCKTIKYQQKEERTHQVTTLMKCSWTFLIVNNSKLVHTDPPILRLPGPLVPHLRLIPQKSHKSHFFHRCHIFHRRPRKLLLLICCPAAAHCLRGGSRARLPQHKSKLNWRTEIEISFRTNTQYWRSEIWISRWTNTNAMQKYTLQTEAFLPLHKQNSFPQKVGWICHLIYYTRWKQLMPKPICTQCFDIFIVCNFHCLKISTTSGELN